MRQHALAYCSLSTAGRKIGAVGNQDLVFCHPGTSRAGKVHFTPTCLASHVYYFGRFSCCYLRFHTTGHIRVKDLTQDLLTIDQPNAWRSRTSKLVEKNECRRFRKTLGLGWCCPLHNDNSRKDFSSSQVYSYCRSQREGFDSFNRAMQGIVTEMLPQTTVTKLST